MIHTPGPIWQGGGHGERELLASSYRSCLELAAEYGCRSVAFPSISTGVYHFPLELAVPIAIETVRHFLERHPQIEQVLFVCFNQTVKDAYDQALAQTK